MASQTYSYRVPEVVIGYPVPPSSATPPPSRGYQVPPSSAIPPPSRGSSATPPLSRGWWRRPLATYPAENDRKPTSKEEAAYITPCCGGLFTVVAVFLILVFVDKAHCHAKLSIQSISVSPSNASTTWHVDFLVKNPRSRYAIYYDGDDTSVRLGPLHAAVLNTSHKPNSRDPKPFSLTFVAENAVSEQLDIKLRAKHKRYVDNDEAGHIDIRCHNFAQRHDNIDKITCHSSFTSLKTLSLVRHRHGR